MKSDYNLGLREGIDFTVRREHWLPRKLGVNCIALGRTLYCRTAAQSIPKHEFLHLVQFHRYGVPRVLVHYLYHVLRNLCRYRNFAEAFRSVPFEVEARAFESASASGSASDPA